jgi:hypothetical protein
MCKKNVRTKTILFWRGPTAVVLRNESVMKNIFKRGYEEIRDRKLLEILKKDRAWLKYKLYCNVYCYFHDLCAKKMFEQKRYVGRHLLTFESQKLNYFGKKVGPTFWHYNIICIWAMPGPFSRFLVIFYPLSPSFKFFVLFYSHFWFHFISLYEIYVNIFVNTHACNST